MQKFFLNSGCPCLSDGYSGRWKDQAKIKEFKKLFLYVGDPLPQFFNFEAMQRINEMWLNPATVDFYIGTFSQIYTPGNVDPLKTVVIAESEPDSPITLDFRTTVPLGNILLRY